MTMAEAFNHQNARQSDSFTLRGKLAFTAALTTTPSVVLVVDPFNLGARSAALGAVFSRYRVKSLLVKFMSSSSSATDTSAALGFLDDVSITGATLPTTYSGIAELRCSATSFIAESVPSFLEWHPVDGKRWFYTDAESGQDPRFFTSATLYGATAAATASMVIEIDFVLVMNGAVDISAL
jgi:hypothetical protein